MTDLINAHLTDDCLGHILDHLPLEDLKLSIALVCHRWNRLQLAASRRRAIALTLASSESGEPESCRLSSDVLSFYQVELENPFQEPQEQIFFVSFPRQGRLLHALMHNFSNVHRLTIYCPNDKPQQNITPAQVVNLLRHFRAQLIHLKLLLPHNRHFVWTPEVYYAMSQCAKLRHLSLHMNSYKLDVDALDDALLRRLEEFYYGHDHVDMFVSCLYSLLKEKCGKLHKFGLYNTNRMYKIRTSRQPSDEMLEFICSRFVRFALPIKDESGLLERQLPSLEYLLWSSADELQLAAEFIRRQMPLLKTIRLNARPQDSNRAISQRSCIFDVFEEESNEIEPSKVSSVTKIEYQGWQPNIKLLWEVFPSARLLTIYERTPPSEIGFRDLKFACTESLYRYNWSERSEMQLIEAVDQLNEDKNKRCFPSCECNLEKIERNIDGVY